MKKRLALADTLRGIAVINMVLYHFCWDMVYLAGYDWKWYGEFPSFVWQQGICWTFILISGFCSGMSAHPVRRGLVVSAMGALVSAVTLIFLPQAAVIFGVLTFLGSAMLLTALLSALMSALGVKTEPEISLAVSAALFIFFRGVNYGYAGLWNRPLFYLPRVLYQGYAAAWAGFTMPGFFSTDYFSILPWFFLFLAGRSVYFLLEKRGLIQSQLQCQLQEKGQSQLQEKGQSQLQEQGQVQIQEQGQEQGQGRRRLLDLDIAFLSWIGRHSLVIYMFHQPALYLLTEGVIILNGR